MHDRLPEIRSPIPWGLCLAALVLTSSALGQAVVPGQLAEVTERTQLFTGKGKKPVMLGRGDIVLVKKIDRWRALVEVKDSPSKGWVRFKHLAAVTEKAAATPQLAEIEDGPPAAETKVVEPAAAVPAVVLDKPLLPPVSQPTAVVTQPVVAAPVAAQKAVEKKAIRVAVYDFRIQGVDERVARVVADNVVAELRKLERVGAVSMSEIRDMLTHEENKQMLGCDDESCVAEIAGALGVDELITGVLSRVGESSVFNIRRIDLNTATVLKTKDQRMDPKNGEEYLAAIGPAVEELYADYPLRQGQQRGVSEQVALMLNPPPLPTWALYTTAGTAAVLALAGCAAGVGNLLSADAYSRYAASGIPPNDPIDGTVLAQHRANTEIWFGVEIGFLAAAVVVGAGAGVLTFFTDWHGYGDL